MSSRTRWVAIAAAAFLFGGGCSTKEIPSGSFRIDVSVDGGETASDISEDTSPDPDIREDIDRGPEEWTQLKGHFGAEIVASLGDKVFARGENDSVFYTEGDGEWHPAVDLPIMSKVAGGLDSVRYAETDEHRYLLGHLDEDTEADLLESPQGKAAFQEIELPDVKRIESLHATNGELVLLSRGGSNLSKGKLHRRNESGGWTHITPGEGDGILGMFDITAAEGFLVAPKPTRDPSIYVSSDGGRSWSKFSPDVDFPTNSIHWVALNGRLYTKASTDKPAQGGTPTVLLQLGPERELSRVPLDAQTVSSIARGGLFNIDGTLYGFTHRGKILRFDLQDHTTEVVMNRRLPDWAYPGGLYTAGERVFMGAVHKTPRVHALSWKPGRDGVNFIPISEAFAWRLYAREGQLWSDSGSMRTWQPSSKTWDSDPEGQIIDETRAMVPAGPAMLRRNQPDSELDIWRRSEGWKATGAFQTPASDNGSEATNTRYGELLTADVYEDGFVLGFDRVTEFFGGSGPDDEEPGEPAALGAGVYTWQPEDNGISRLTYNASPDGERPGIRALATHRGDIWVAVSPFSNPAGRDASRVYRIREGQWTHMSGDDLSNVQTLKSHGGTLYAASSDGEQDPTSFATWSSQEQQFEPLTPVSDGENSFRKLTEQGPLHVTSQGAFLHDGDSG